MAMKIIRSTETEAMKRLLEQSRQDLALAAKTAARIIEDVRTRGDRALLHWAEKFDSHHEPRRRPTLLEARDTRHLRTFTPAQMKAACARVTPRVRHALQLARRNIETMAHWQMPAEWTRNMREGLAVGQLVRPLESVGCYVPGGRHPLPSTVLMTTVPARVAGVKRVVVACPHAADEVLAAAHLAGVHAVYEMGGAQAIAALAYGTESVTPVEKIVGPGNVFVTAAKRLVADDCAIDFLAGPTEVLIVAAGTPGAEENPAFIAADLLAQAEHAPDASAWLLTPSQSLALRVQAEVEKALAGAESWKAIAKTSLQKRGVIILTRDVEDAMDWANRIAPEHITVPRALVGAVRNAGSVFVGEYAPQAVGDYLSGTNHVLPTARLARARGGLSVADFLKIITVQELTAGGLKSLAAPISVLARAEGLEAHARSVEVRVAGLAQRARSSRQN